MSTHPQVPEPARRQPVWLALGELYLDTELAEEDFRRIAAILAASGFSWDEVREMNYNEVAPALLSNLQSVAGEWAGWDERWLIERLNSSYQLQPHRQFGSVRLWQKIVDFYTKRPLAAIAACLL